MGPLRRRTGLGALELALALALLAAILVLLPSPRAAAARRGAPLEEVLARRMERILARIQQARAVREPVATPSDPVSLPSRRLVLELPDGSVTVLRADSFEVRRRGPEAYLVRVRLVGTRAALFSAAEVGSWIEGSSP